MTHFFTIPGYGNSDENHWQTYFEKQLPNCIRIHQKSWEYPICEDWVSNIDSALKGYDLSKVVIITHSMGGIALAHWIEKYNVTLKGAMIVAPPDLENPWKELNLGSFTPIPLTPFSFPSILIASAKDHWATLERSQFFAHSWGSELVVLENAGHINPEAGFTNWEDGLTILKKLL